MGSNDNKSYAKVRLELAKIYKPSQYNSLYNNLLRIAYTTEDERLVSLINNYCGLISNVPSLVIKKMPQSISNTIAGAQNAKMELDTYCMEAILANKPEWQIIAENKGWKPPV
jgi:hypothetical protein